MQVGNKDLIKCLPLLASMLGNEYGIEVRIGGGSAVSNGKIIQLPSLPLDNKDVLVPMVRGFVDHESAHIRFSDFECLTRANLDNVTKHLANAIEDWRVESRMSVVYPGCQQHFRWLILRYILPQEGEIFCHDKPLFAVLDYVTVTVRTWYVPELDATWLSLRQLLCKQFPGLPDAFDSILARVRAHCPSTMAAIEYARQLADIIRKWQPQSSVNLSSQKDEGHGDMQEGGSQSGNDNAGSSCGAVSQASEENDAVNTPQNSILEGIEKALEASPDNVIRGVGEQVAGNLEDICFSPDQVSIAIATVGDKSIKVLSSRERNAALKAASGLRHRLQGLLQAQTQKSCAVGRRGTLDTRLLHRLAVGNPKVFRREASQRGIDTACHILIDSSGSMQGQHIKLACHAAFATAKALEHIHNVNLGVSGFPSSDYHEGVYPLVRHGERVTAQFSVRADGGTPLDAALMWVVHQLSLQKEQRKIALVVTDGQPDNAKATRAVIAQAKKLGMELFGIGVRYAGVQYFFKDKCCAISSIEELPQALFSMLQTALLNGGPHAHAA